MLAVAELFMRGLPVIQGRIRALDESHWPLRNYQPDQAYQYSFGWDLRHGQRGRSNNFGQLAPFDFQSGRAQVAVIGDSFVESAMNAYEDSLHAQMAQRLGRPDAAIGLAASGLSAVDYTVMVEQALRDLAPKALVLVLIDGDLSEGLHERRGWHHLDEQGQRHYRPLRGDGQGAFSGSLASSSLWGYLRRNLGWQPPSLQSLKSTLTASPPPTPAEPRAKGPQDGPRAGQGLPAVRALMQTLQSQTQIPPTCIAVLFDSDRGQLYGRKPQPLKDDAASRAALVLALRQAGMAAVDLGEHFARHYATHGQRFDHSPIDSHWNALGHQVAAEAALQALAACPATQNPTP